MSAYGGKADITIMRFFRQMLAARIPRFHSDPVAALKAAAVGKPA
jgi:hypothetical protein